jgi:hypothetical protein
LDFWTKLFPGDHKWLERMESLLNSKVPQTRWKRRRNIQSSE